MQVKKKIRFSSAFLPACHFMAHNTDYPAYLFFLFTIYAVFVNIL